MMESMERCGQTKKVARRHIRSYLYEMVILVNCLYCPNDFLRKYIQKRKKLVNIESLTTKGIRAVPDEK
ncbi:MAG: hypothetical protein LBT40_05860, partial [Deltaproteobacteria bacterium]|nr:hypothetical protein [Deltaproteobacteria bacterium]